MEVVRADLTDWASLASLAETPNVIFLAGQKFGTRGDPSGTWAMNVVAPVLCAERYAGSRVVAAVATLADRLGPQSEKLSKSIIFLPMAISGVGAATIWRFIYEARPEGEPQIGLQNAVWTALGFDPVAWLQVDTLHFNSFLLMVILIWAQVGFSMVLLSAAVKGVPVDTLEAARIDGANERQIFFRVIVPQIWATVITVFITVLISVMKIFDVVYVMTNGNFNTDVIAVNFFNELFRNGNNGRASAIVVMLMIAVLPVIIYQVRHFRAEEAAR